MRKFKITPPVEVTVLLIFMSFIFGLMLSDSLPGPTPTLVERNEVENTIDENMAEWHNNLDRLTNHMFLEGSCQAIMDDPSKLVSEDLILFDTNTRTALKASMLAQGFIIKIRTGEISSLNDLHLALSMNARNLSQQEISYLLGIVKNNI